MLENARIGHVSRLTKPLPRMEIADLVHMLEDASGEKARDDVGNGIAGMPYGHASWIFLFVVPGRCDQGYAREEGSFTEADNEANHAEASTTRNRQSP
jgi:hypothetical protein